MSTSTRSKQSIRSLGEVARFLRGITFKPEDVVQPGTEGSVVCMRTKNVQTDLDQSDLIAVPSRFVRREELYLRESDILVSTANSWDLVGKCSWVPKLEYDATAGGFISILRANNGIVLPRYLYYWFNSNATQHAVRLCGRQTTNISNMSYGRCEALELLLPPLPEQKRIASILDKADAIRRKRGEAVRFAEKLKEASFLELFGDPRWSRKSWPETFLADVTDLDAPMVDPREDQYQNLLHVGPDRIEKETGRLLPASTAAEERLISGKFLFDERYLLYSKIRPYLRKVAMPDFRGLCSADVYPVRPRAGKATREYLFSLLISEAFLSYTQSLSSRASIPKLNRDEFGKYRFPLPPLRLQKKYTAVFNQQVHCVQRLSRASEESEKLFQCLVQRAFAGEL